MIEAAGGVVWRRATDGGIEVLLVHRPRYDDWSFPKGKLDPGEGALDAALREVEEETGLRCRAGPALGEVRYVDHQGRDKRSRYWAMQVVDGAAHETGEGAGTEGFVPTDEVDELRWLSPPDARRRLSYPHDAAVLDAVDRLDLG